MENEARGDYNVTVKVRNNRLLSLMRDYGYKTNAQFSRAIGVRQVDIGKILNLKMSAYDLKGNERACVKAICNALYCFPEDIFPPELLHNSLERNSVEVGFSSEQVQELMQVGGPEEMLEISDASKVVTGVLSELSNREQQVINMFFGLDGEEEKTLNDIAKIYDISPARAMQIKNAAMAKMRHPAKSDRLRVLLPEYAGSDCNA